MQRKIEVFSGSQSKSYGTSTDFRQKISPIQLITWAVIGLFCTYWCITYRLIKYHTEISSAPRALIGGNLRRKDHQPDLNDLCVTRRQFSKQCYLEPCKGSSKAKDTNMAYTGINFRRSKSIVKGEMGSYMGIGQGPTSGCVISHRYKFIYLHVLKSGGSYIKNFLKVGLCGDDSPSCLAGEHMFSTKLSCAEMVKQFPDYFTWSMVRNPFSRMYSAYSMLKGNPRDESSKKIKFSSFVLTPELREFVSVMSSTHYAPQHQFLFDNNECPNFDFLGRLENIEQDMKFILQRIGSGELRDLFESSNHSINKGSNTWGSDSIKQELGGDLRVAYEKETMIKKVADEFAKDFRLLGYDDQVVPQN